METKSKKLIMLFNICDRSKEAELLPRSKDKSPCTMGEAQANAWLGPNILPS